MNQQYMMNVSRYQHRWKPEQDQYKNYAKQQTAANQRIRRKVRFKNNVVTFYFVFPFFYSEHTW